MEVKKEEPPVGTLVPKASPKRTKVYDFGLAEKWDDNRACRELLRDSGKLIRWLSEDQVNVFNLETLGLNSQLMCSVVDYHCSRTTVVKAPPIDFLKAQVRVLKKKGWPNRLHKSKAKIIFNHYDFYLVFKM